MLRLALVAALAFSVGGALIIATFIPVLLSSFDEAVAITANVHETTTFALRDTMADSVRRTSTVVEEMAAYYGRGDAWPTTAEQIEYMVNLYNHTGGMIEQIHTGRKDNGDFVSLYRLKLPYRRVWKLSVRNASVPCRRSFALDIATGAQPFINGTERCSYDPRLRSWYRQLDAPFLQNTPPTPMSDDPGVKVYIGRRVTGLRNTSADLGVLHIDMSTDFLKLALRRNPIGKTGVAWLYALTDTGDFVYAISWTSEPTTDLSEYDPAALNPVVRAKNLTQLEHPLVRRARAALGDAELLAPFTGSHLTLAHRDGLFASVVDIPTPQVRTLRLRLAVVIEERDYLSGIERQRVMSIALAVVVVVVVAVALSGIMWWVASPLTAIAADMADVTALRPGVLERGASDAAAARSCVSEIATLQGAYASLSTAVGGFVRYVPKDVVRELMATGELGSLTMEPRKVAIVFTDIRGFTTLCESVQPDTLANLVCEYFTAMTQTVSAHGGVVDKFIGDAVMALWGAPRKVPHPELLATLCALWMHRQTGLAPLAPLFRQAGHELAIRAGVAVGHVLAGNMGSMQRMNYTVMGDAVNLAARLESLNKQLGTGTLVPAAVAERVADRLVLRLLGRIAVVGKSEAVDVFEAIGVRANADLRTAANETADFNGSREEGMVMLNASFESADLGMSQSGQVTPSNSASVLAGSFQGHQQYRDQVHKIFDRAAKHLLVSDEDAAFSDRFTSAVSAFHDAKFDEAAARLDHAEQLASRTSKYTAHPSIAAFRGRLDAARTAPADAPFDPRIRAEAK